jgi:hypothetical protein
MHDHDGSCAVKALPPFSCAATTHPGPDDTTGWRQLFHHIGELPRLSGNSGRCRRMTTSFDQQSHSIAEVCACSCCCAWNSCMGYIQLVLPPYITVLPFFSGLYWRYVRQRSCFPRQSHWLFCLSFVRDLSIIFHYACLWQGPHCGSRSERSLGYTRRIQMEYAGMLNLQYNWLICLGSPLGTFDYGHLSHYLTDNPLPQGKPWAGRTAKVSRDLIEF